MKYLTTKLSFLFTLTLLFLASIWLLTQTITLNQLTGLLNSQLATLTSQPVKLSGDIKLKLLPKPSISIPLIELGHHDPQSPYFAKLENLLLRISISQFLQGKLRFKAVEVQGFDIQLHLPFTLTPSQQTPATLPADATSFFQIKRFTLNKGKISIFYPLYTIHLDGLQLTADQINLDHQPVLLQLKTQLELTPQTSTSTLS